MHLPFVDGTGTKIAFYAGKTNFNLTMKVKKTSEQIIEQLERTFKHDFELVSHNFTDLKQEGCKRKNATARTRISAKDGQSQAKRLSGQFYCLQTWAFNEVHPARSRDIQTTFGWIRIKRASYRVFASLYKYQ